MRLSSPEYTMSKLIYIPREKKEEDWEGEAAGSVKDRNTWNKYHIG